MDILTGTWEEARELLAKAVVKSVEEHREGAKIVSPYCLKANLWLPRSSDNLVSNIKLLIEKGQVNPKDIQNEYIRFFEKDNWQALGDMVNSWMQSQFFKPREAIIRDAFKAHRDGLFNLSIPALLPQIEGVASSLVDDNSTSGIAGLVNKATEKYAKNYMDIEHEKEQILNLLVQPYYFASPGKSKAKAKEKLQSWWEEENPDDILSRDAILHGLSIGYGSKLNSLKVFLVLDFLFWMKREDLDKALRVIFSRHRKQT
jgi:hypothetical protein